MIYAQKLDLTLFKLYQKINNKQNRYTGLPEPNILQKDISSLEWSLEFLDKRMNKIVVLETNEQNIFEAGFSIVWSNLSKFSDKFNEEIVKIRFYTNLPVYLDLSNGKLSLINPKNSNLNINNKKILLEEFDFSFKEKKIKTFTASKVYTGKLISIYEINKEFLFSFWNTENQNVSNI